MSGKLAVQEEFDLYEDFSGQPAGAALSREQASDSQPVPSASERDLEDQQPPEATGATSNDTKRAIVNVAGSLYIGNLQWWTTDAELDQLCAPYGSITELKIFDERSNGKSKGYALVEFLNAGDAKACKDGLNGRTLHGKNVVVTFTSKPNSSSQASPSNLFSKPTGGQRDSGRGRMAMGGGRGRGPRPQQSYQEEAGYEDRRYPSPQPGMMGGMPMPLHMMVPGAMMPMGAMMPAGLPMPGMGFPQQEQPWDSEYDGYNNGFKRQRYF